MIANAAPPDIFEEIRQHYTVPQAWQALGLPGEPKEHGNMRSPFRDEHTPSFTIYEDGSKWKDHGTGDGGDVIEFIRVSLGTDHAGVREWGKEKFGIDHLDGRIAPRPLPQRPAKAPEAWKPIVWPGELVEGNRETADAFAAKRGLSSAGVSFAVRAGVLRFLRLADGRACYCVTDSTRRAAEIRDWNGQPFGSSKAFPLSGCSKRWLPGLAHAVTTSPGEAAGILITEGATDLLTAYDAYHRWKLRGGQESWIPAAILGAGCKMLAPEAEDAIRGRRVRLVPDADPAGDEMADHWRGVFLSLGCTVDTLKLPRGSDLSDVAGKIKLEALFS